MESDRIDNNNALDVAEAYAFFLIVWILSFIPSAKELVARSLAKARPTYEPDTSDLI